MKDIFSRLKLKDNNLELCDAIDDDIVSDFFGGFKLDEMLTCNETAQSLPATPLLSAYLKRACNERKYFFLLRNVGSIPVLLVLLLDYPLTCFLPYTIYQTLNQAKSMKAITGIWRNLWYRNIKLPSNTNTQKSNSITFNLLKQHASNTQFFIKCHYCNEPCLIFSKLKVSPNVTLKLKRETLDLFHICGTSIAELSSNTAYLLQET